VSVFGRGWEQVREHRADIAETNALIEELHRLFPLPSLPE